MSKIFEGILSKAIKKPLQIIKNSLDFKRKISDTKIPDNCIMVSFDVVSIYPSIPLELIKDSLRSRWTEITKFKNLPMDEFIKVIDFLMNNTYFKFNNRYFKQIYGTAVGDSCAAILCDLVFYNLEDELLNIFENDIVFYGRFVDEIFLIIPKNKLIEIFDKFNGYHERIKFTYEIENYNKLNFLDLTICRKNDG